MAGHPPNKAGYLTKLGARAKNWKRRYFVVSDSVIKYYVDDSFADLRGSFTIENAKISIVNSAEAGKEHAFSICPVDSERVYLVFAASAQERKEWLDVLADASAVKKRSIKNGFMAIQKGTVSKTWKKRFFILTPSTLYYQKTNSGGAIVDEISLSAGTSVTPEPDEGERRFVFSVTSAKLPHTQPHQKRFIIQANNDIEMRDWIKAIQALMRDSRTSNAHILPPSPTSREPRRSSVITVEKKLPEPTYTHSRTRAGWLKKQGAVVKNWKYRFFVLSNGMMFYFTEEEEATPQGLAKGMRPKGYFPCMHAITEREPHPPFTFSVTPVDSKRKYILVGSSDSDAKLWMRGITNVTDLAGVDLLSLVRSNEPSSEDEKGSDSAGDEDRVAVMTDLASPKDSKEPRLSRRLTSFLKNQAGDITPLPEIGVEDYCASDSVKEGWLMKLVRRRSTLVRWHKRYFILHDDNLKYYDHKPARTELGRIKGVMLLGGAELTLEKEVVGGRNNVVTIQFTLNSKKEAPIQLSNPDAAVMELWVAAIRKQIAAFTKSEPKAKGLIGAKQAYFYRLIQGDEWHREYWVLVLDRGAQIHIFDSHLLKGQGTMLDMKNSTIVLHPNDSYDRACAFSITMRRGEEYVCAAEDRETLEDWVNLLMGI